MDIGRMNVPGVIGLSGYKRSGKDTVAQFLSVYGYKPYALAGPVKRTALAIDPLLPGPHWGMEPVRLSWLVDELGWEGAKENPEVRRLLQQIGTEGGREIHGDDVWLNLAARTIFAEPDHRRWVITDVRFPNEAEWVREVLKGQVWKIVRPGGSADGHASETGVDLIKPDRTLNNDGTLKDLAQAVDDILFPRVFAETALD